ncbi:FLYWCH zinc finger domain-containing protein [Phthorimaea operculella]|nr:FLYWCH zinc finger domain-containing protein [Phthorimaea operculella]
MVTSRKGQPLLLLGEHSFFKKMKKRGCGLKANWACSTHHSKTMGGTNPGKRVFIVKNLNGKPRAVYKGYPFYLKQQTKISLSWFCTRYPTCTAQLTTTTTGELRRVKNPEHNHQPNQFIMLFFVQNSNGKQLALYQDYCFNLNRREKNIYSWVCTRHHALNAKCKAAISTTACQMITLEPGVQALLCGSFTFNRKQGSTGRWRWYCSRYHRGCRAGVITTDSLEVLVYTGDHNHAPPNLVKTTSGIYRQIVKNSTGKPVLIYQGYNYCIHGISSATTNWRCSRHSSQKCKARVITLADGFVLRTSGCHTHPATRFDIRDGVFFYY